MEVLKSSFLWHS